MSLKRTRRLLAVVAAAAAVSLGAAGCDSSPVAASVNGTLIKQTELRAVMRGLASSPQFVQAADSSGSLTVQGSSPGTFSNAFAISTLAGLVSDVAIRQHLSATGRAVPADMLAASRAYAEQVVSGWFQFSPAIRDRLVQQYADVVAAEPLPSDVSEAQQFFLDPSKSAYFFRQVCVRTIAVTVPDGSGGVDFPASLSRAQQIQATDFSTTTTSSTTAPSTTTTTAPAAGAASTTTTSTSADTGSSTSTSSTTAPGPSAAGGSVLCYDPSQLEQQGQAFFDTVLGLAPGQSTNPQRTSYGYTLVAVDSRQLLPFNQDVGAVLSYLALNPPPPGAQQTISAILAKARVSVNPSFGRWESTAQGTGLAPPAVPSQLSADLGYSLAPSNG